MRRLFALLAVVVPTLNAAAATITFQEGFGAYTGTTSLSIAQGSPNSALTGKTAQVDQRTTTYGGNGEAQLLLRFDDLFGTTAIPTGASIQNATLRLYTVGGTAGVVELYRMNTAWTTASTWNSLSAGITAGIDTPASPEARRTAPAAKTTASFDVTASLQAWRAGQTNNGWALVTDSLDNWVVQTENYTSRNQTTLALHRPLLTVDYLPFVPSSSVPVPPAVWLLVSGVVFLSARRKALG